MQVAQLVNSSTSRYIPTTAPAIFAGQAISRANVPVNSQAGGSTTLGIAQADLPAFTTGPQTDGIRYNQPRTLNIATNGRLAIRVAAIAQFTALPLGGNFGLINGDAVAVGVGGTIAAVTLNGDLLVIDEKIVGVDGFGYILVYFN